MLGCFCLHRLHDPVLDILLSLHIGYVKQELVRSITGIAAPCLEKKVGWAG